MFELPHKNITVPEDKKFAGQPVLSQILDTIASSIINAANRKHKANGYYKRIPLRIHLVRCYMGCLAIVMG
jgi:hypothetical protein